MLMRSAQHSHLGSNVSSELTPDMKIGEMPGVQLIVTLSFTTGLVMCFMSLFKLYFITSYLSDSLIRGFTTAAAMQIMMTQIAPILQLKVPTRSGLFKFVYVSRTTFEKCIFLNSKIAHTVPQKNNINFLQKISGYLIFLKMPHFQELIDVLSDLNEANIAVFILSIICIIVLYVGKNYLAPFIKKFSPIPLPIESIVVKFKRYFEKYRCRSL